MPWVWRGEVFVAEAGVVLKNKVKYQKFDKIIKVASFLSQKKSWGQWQL